jgi:gamma-glutamyltranspeptidase/glutathione hydrolase
MTFRCAWTGACALSLGAVTLWCQTSTWRPVYLGTHGMVATAHYSTAMAGYRMLAQGGNAVDAAIAAAFASTAAEPSRSGIGGDLFMLIYLAKTGQVLCINGGGWAPRRATAELFRTSATLSQDGPLAPVVPGAPAALLLAARRYSRLPREKLLAPAIELAERGSPVSENLENVFRRNAGRLKPFPSTASAWFPGGISPRMGDVLPRPELAATLRRIAAGGHDEFYRGKTARRLVEFLGRQGGLMDADDLAEFAAETPEPLHIRYRGYDVYSIPPQTQGHVMLQALRILEGFDLRAMKHNSADYIHHTAEALKLAFADREAFTGDPRFVRGIPMERLLSEEYAAARRKLIRPDRAIEGDAPPGRARGGLPAYAAARGRHVELAGPDAFPNWVESFTTYIGAADREGNMVSITSSIAADFGSALFVDGDGGGYFINDVLARFHLDPGHPNELAPRKRPRQTLNPVLVAKDGKALMVFGSPGGDTQPQSQLQFFLNFVEFRMNVQQALEQPYFVTNAYHESWHPHRAGKRLSVSSRIGRDVREELARRGHEVATHSAMGVGSVKAIVLDSGRHVLMGGAAPATDSYVIGW